MSGDARPDTTGLREDLTADEASELVEDDIRYWLGNRFMDPAMVLAKVCHWITTASLAAHHDPTPEPQCGHFPTCQRFPTGYLCEPDCPMVWNPDPTPEPDAGDVEALAEVVAKALDVSGLQKAVPVVMEDRIADTILASDWLANQRRTAREQGRAEGEAEFAAAVEGLADKWLDGFRYQSGPFVRGEGDCSDILRALLTADRTKALDAVKASAWDEGASANAENSAREMWMDGEPIANPYRDTDAES